MAHTHDVYDMEKHFEINGSSRFIKETSETKLVVVQGDHKSEVLTFKMPRYIDGHDMTLCNKIRIHYINLDTKTNNKSADVYEVTDLTLCEECEDVLTFTWTIEAPATKYSGTLSFLVKFECTEGENVLYQWNTAKYVSVNVLAGIDNSEEFVDKYSNVLEEWYNELAKGADSIEELNQQAIAEIELAKEDAKEDIQGKANSTMDAMTKHSNDAYNSFKDNVDEKMGTMTQHASNTYEEFVSDVNKKAEETLESIPDDYTALAEEVNELSEHLVTQKEVFDEWQKPYFNCGKNKFDRTKLITGYALHEGTGELLVSPYYSVSVFISVKENTTYYRNLESNVVFYDATFKMISGITFGTGAFTTPINTAYIRISCGNGYLSKLQIEEGESGTPYEAYRFFNTDIIPIDAIKNSMVGKNKFDKLSAVTGIVNIVDGIVYNNGEEANYVTSDFIPVVSGETYTRNTDGNFAFYDENKIFVYHEVLSGNLKITIPDGISYIRISVLKNKIDILQFELGNRKTSYEPFGHINTDLLYGYQIEQMYHRSQIRKPLPTTIKPTIELPDGTTISVEDKDKDGNLYGIRWDNIIYKHFNGKPSHSWSGENGKIVIDVNPFLNEGETISLFNMRVTDTGRICVATNKGRVLVSDEEQTTFREAFSFQHGYSQNTWGADKYENIVLFASYGKQNADESPHEVYISEDYGATWRKLFDMANENMDRPDMFHIHDVAIDPFSGALIVVTGDMGLDPNIYYSYDNGSTWKKVNPTAGCKIHPTSIVCLPKGIAFGSDDIPEGIYWWERPYGVDKPEIVEDDIVGVDLFNHDYVLQGVIGVKGDYLITNHGVYAVIGFLNHRTTTPGNPRLYVTGDGGVSWHRVFYEEDENMVGFFNAHLIEENGKVRIYANYVKEENNYNLFVADMPVFYSE